MSAANEPADAAALRHARRRRGRRQVHRARRRCAMRCWRRGAEVVCTREPGGTPLAEQHPRAAARSRATNRASAETELLLMFAARAQHVRETIAAGAAARRVGAVSDRFTDASYAYQGGGRGLDTAFIAELERRVVGIAPGPDAAARRAASQHGRERARGRDLRARPHRTRARRLLRARARRLPRARRRRAATLPRDRCHRQPPKMSRAQAVAHLLQHYIEHARDEHRFAPWQQRVYEQAC